MTLPRDPDWTIGPLGPEREVAVDPQDRASASLVVRHPGAPLVRHLEGGGDTPTVLQRAALAYLEHINNRFSDLVPDRWQALVRKWLDALADGRSPRFGWLPLPDTKIGHPMVSFSLGRTVVLLASERLGSANRSEDFIASGFGLRVVGHLRQVATPSPHLAFAITGFSASLPFGSYRDRSLAFDNNVEISLKGFGELLAQGARDILAALSLYDEPWFTRLRLHRVASGRVAFEAQGTSYDRPFNRNDPDQAGQTAYGFLVRGTASDSGGAMALEPLERLPLVAFATPSRRAFRVDPASHGKPPSDRERRVTRPAGELEGYLGDLVLPRSPLANVRTGKLVRPGLLPVPTAAGIRSDDFGQRSAEVNLDGLFDRLARWGIVPKLYFRAASETVNAVCRSGISPGPGKDGLAVNARVSLGGWNKSFFDTMELADQPAITMHFAVGDLSTRTRTRRAGNAVAPAEYLGIAADPRWVWHEIGHVLLAGAVGELELRFAHSPGDALAAIALDPDSRLQGCARGATFPWVFIPRRHDRCAAHGWSWTGAMHLRANRRAFPDRHPLKGYWSEQILSSCLFRLYRALGGDTARADGTPDRVAREAASDYTLCLIVKAIGLLGYAGAVPAHTPDHFVSALIEADVGTETFLSTIQDGGTPRIFKRVGGCAHKVIRWAFETQGLYAPGFTNGPGLPPRVDLYIADGRPDEDAMDGGATRYDKGSYAPVSLGWTPADTGDAPWHAAGAIEVDGSSLFVTVGNRGQEAATNVEVKVWVRAPDAGPALPEREGEAGWADCPPPANAPATVAAGGSVRYGPFILPSTVAAPFVILAVATCPDDPANTEVATQLPCARLPVGLPDLVAGDNNLGLRYWR